MAANVPWTYKLRNTWSRVNPCARAQNLYDRDLFEGANVFIENVDMSNYKKCLPGSSIRLMHTGPKRYCTFTQTEAILSVGDPNKMQHTSDGSGTVFTVKVRSIFTT